LGDENIFWKTGHNNTSKKLTVFLVNFFSLSFTALFAVVVTTTGKYGK
jgi:hypothetical protein